MQEKRKQVVKAIKNGYLIEYHFNDNSHTTLNLSIYDENLDVLQMLSSKKGRSSSDTNYFRDCI